MQWSDNFNESVHENLEELWYHNIEFSEYFVSALTETIFQLVARQHIHMCLHIVMQYM